MDDVTEVGSINSFLNSMNIVQDCLGEISLPDNISCGMTVGIDSGIIYGMLLDKTSRIFRIFGEPVNTSKLLSFHGKKGSINTSIHCHELYTTFIKESNVNSDDMATFSDLKTTIIGNNESINYYSISKGLTMSDENALQSPIKVTIKKKSFFGKINKYKKLKSTTNKVEIDEENNINNVNTKKNKKRRSSIKEVLNFDNTHAMIKSELKKNPKLMTAYHKANFEETKQKYNEILIIFICVSCIFGIIGLILTQTDEDNNDSMTDLISISVGMGIAILFWLVRLLSFKYNSAILCYLSTVLILVGGSYNLFYSFKLLELGHIGGVNVLYFSVVYGALCDLPFKLLLPTNIGITTMHTIMYWNIGYNAFRNLYICSFIGYFIVSLWYSNIIENRKQEYFVINELHKSDNKTTVITNGLPKFVVDKIQDNSNNNDFIDELKNCFIMVINIIGFENKINNDNYKIYNEFINELNKKINHQLRSYKDILKIDTSENTFMYINVKKTGYNEILKLAEYFQTEFNNLIQNKNINDFNLSISCHFTDLFGYIMGKIVKKYHITINNSNTIKSIQKQNIYNKILCSNEFTAQCTFADFKFDQVSNISFALTV